MLEDESSNEQDGILSSSVKNKKNSYYKIGTVFFLFFLVINVFLYIDYPDKYNYFILQKTPSNITTTNYSRILINEKNITCSCDSNFLNDKYTGKRRKIFVLGFPKGGTSSLHNLFKCMGYNSCHWKTRRGYIGKLMFNAYNKSLPILEYLPDCNAFAQMDVEDYRNNYWPQLELFKTINREVPNSLFVLNYRNVTNHYNSMKRFHNMLDRINRLEIKGLPKNKGKKFSEFEKWVVAHYYDVENYFTEIGQIHRLLILDIESAKAEERLKEFFHCKKLKWSKYNARKNKI